MRPSQYGDHGLVASMVGNLAVAGAHVRGGHRDESAAAGRRPLEQRRRLPQTAPPSSCYGMPAAEMRGIAGLMADVLQRRQDPAAVRSAAIDLRRAFPTLQFCFPLHD